MLVTILLLVQKIFLGKMDDFIYFLLVIGWLGYSFYKQSEKKKRQQAARNIEQQAGTMPEQSTPVFTEREESAEVPSQPDFRKTIEEFLLGEEQTLEQIPQNGPQSLEVIPEPAVSDENRYQKYSNVETSQQSAWQQQIIVTDDKEAYRTGDANAACAFIEEEDRADLWEGFNLRKAVIYSEILNRKYAF